MKLNKDITSRWVYDDQVSETYMSAAVMQNNSGQEWHVNILGQHHSPITRDQLIVIRDFANAILADSED